MTLLVNITTKGNICGDCALAIRSRIERQQGVKAVAVDNAGVAVAFDEQRISQEEVRTIARRVLRRHGHPPVR